MCVYSPYNMHDIQMGNGSLAQLDFVMCDNNFKTYFAGYTNSRATNPPY